MLFRIKAREKKPSIINQQSILYPFKCNLYDSDWLATQLATHSCINVLTNIRGPRSGNTSKRNMSDTDIRFKVAEHSFRARSC